MQHHIFSKYYNIQYPVAEHIDVNHPLFTEMANSYYEFAKDELNVNRNITLICRGSSGAIAATIFYLALKNLMPEKHINIVHVKKAGESSHCNSLSSINVDNINIFVDDFIFTGSTVTDTLTKIRKEYDRLSAFTFDYIVVGFINYKSCSLFTDDTITKNIVYSHQWDN